ncbi:hypothetical protein MetexDRAFT_0193 [Methylorubrum extorquens DSM 13060]|uniref:Uncharacterized protein n=1 Tax=Methylorubrum extorquens DSM 13060 TaxID=882800 RepID=H1KC31_METEX|nr:hypothetical protein MetexDRAFT_0193 [Methylorubrum extorquens DSM 13060]
MSRFPTDLEGLHRACLDWRGIDPDEACKECGGSGIKVYGDTSTWRGGVGGQSLTQDVCDHCWGSGNRLQPWMSHRRLAASATETRQGEDA